MAEVSILHQNTHQDSQGSAVYDISHYTSCSSGMFLLGIHQRQSSCLLDNWSAQTTRTYLKLKIGIKNYRDFYDPKLNNN